MAFDATVAKLEHDKAAWTAELEYLDTQEAYWQSFIDQQQARRTEVQALLGEVDGALALLRGAFD